MKVNTTPRRLAPACRFTLVTTLSSMVLVAVAMLGLPGTARAQSPPFQWVTTAGGADRDKALGIAVDGAGNAYMTGFYQRIATFGGTSIGTTNDDFYNIFI